MKSKNEIQKEIDNLQQQTKDLTARREALRAERNEVAASIDAQAKAIGAALLDDLDTTKESDTLARDRAKLEGLDEAITQADTRLADLKRQREDAVRAFALVDFSRLADEADALLVTSVDKLCAAATELNALKAKFDELHQISGATGVNIDYHDHLRAVERLSRFLREGLEAKLKATEEQGAANALAEARAKKGK